MDRAIVLRPQFPPGRRIIAVSDIHGHLDFFRRLMVGLSLVPEDILVLAGDILEKGPDSLALLRHIMALSRTHTVYPLCGNCDGLVLRFFESDALDERFYRFYLPRHPESTLRQLAREGGFDQTEDLPRLRRDLRAAFPEIRAWLGTLPTILETEHLVFVHGGVPALTGMEELERWGCMKNDDFLGQGHAFSKWVIVGHWPVTLYHPHIPSAAPILLRERRILSIDGGCVLKLDGQLNALVLPGEGSEDFAWAAWDGLPAVHALDAQEPSADPLNIRWGRSRLELLVRGEETSLCRHLETGRVLPILNSYLRQGEQGLWCEDSTDYALPVQPGDRMALVARTRAGDLCKKDGRTGWYFGRLTPAAPPAVFSGPFSLGYAR
ncbi:MAG: serine/threonine protein phosphatase [Lawsonibacter sp.]|nr:serine/threonine protein phosphatase [Lawsonibacter sp.]